MSYASHMSRMNVAFLIGAAIFLIVVAVNALIHLLHAG